MIRKLKMWYASWCSVLTEQQIIEWELIFVRNVYGDEINYLNCRSIWKDSKGRTYRAESLLKIDNYKYE